MTSFASQIIETANALGMDPMDLATIISYETAGTFDPSKAGPTTQYGQHRGLIQFGEPQAQQYGVNWSDPVGSQLGSDGAVARYFRDNGYKPGMGLLDAYSIVNAGAPGRYTASDANNGGAPGTVADKVYGQMAGHKANAARYLGFSYGDLALGHEKAAESLPYNIGTEAENPWEKASGLLSAFIDAQSQQEAPEIAPRQVAQYMPERRDNASLMQFLASLR